MRAIGLDGFKRGWVAVLLDGDEQAISFHPSVGEALSQSFDRATIDIPIGLTDDGERSCDRLARAKLRPHTSRVFAGARRWLWQEFDDPDEANKEALRRGQKRVSRQLWHLGPKIMEVDVFARGHRAGDLREVHPELVFLQLNGGAPLASKKSKEGDCLRRELLKRAGLREIDRWLSVERIRSGADRDDVLDACAAAIAAREPSGCLPEGEVPFDRYGMPMQIWY